MYIIFGSKIAEELRQSNIILQLETFTAQGVEHTAYCVVKPESVILEMEHVERNTALHQATVDAWNKQDYQTVKEGITHLRGRFSGELDSFYDELSSRMERMKKEQEIDQPENK